MKIKPLLFFLLLTSISTQTFALELKNATIISHKEWTTGGAKGWVTHGNKNQVGKPADSSAATAYVASAEGYTHSNTYIYGSHYYYIVNSTDRTETYEYQYKLCADNTQCVYYVDDIEIRPEGSVTDSATSTVAAYFDKPGIYQSMAYTAIKGRVPAEDTSNSTIDIRNLN